MLHLIERALPQELHRLALRLAFRIRHHWRRLRKTPITGCNVIITDLKGELLLLRHSYGPVIWALPGGGVKRGEDPAEAARREIKEELGFEGGNLKAMGWYESVLSGSPHTSHLFTLVVNSLPRPDMREVIEARFFPLHSLPEPLGDVTRQHISSWADSKRAGT